MTGKKIPQHLQPLHNELSAVYKDGRFQNEVGETFKTAKDAVAHNDKLDKWLDGFIANEKKRKYGLKTVVYDPNKKQTTKPKTTIRSSLDFEKEMAGIRSGLKILEDNRKLLNQSKNNQLPIAAEPKTSTGINYLMGFDDE